MIRICRSAEHEWGELEGGVSPRPENVESPMERFETYSRHRSDDLEEVGEHMARNTCGARADRIGLSARSKPRQGYRLDSCRVFFKGTYLGPI
jgi:hypothetical protein